MALELIETPELSSLVSEGALPAIDQRLPQDYQLVEFKNRFKPGQHGGELRLLMGKQKDIRQITVYAYARLVHYDTDYQLKPDLLKAVDNVDNKEFTLHLRRGHKWSDGHPFTTEDFRYYWEDIANNPDLSKGQLNKNLLVDGKGPEVEFIDKHTVRYRWQKPNPLFLPALAAPRPLYIYKPAHYLKKYHPNHTDPEIIESRVKKKKKRNWMSIHVKKDRPYKATNPDLPTLQPWFNSTYPPSERFIFKRNPYYHRVDSQGRQLPYIDKVVVNIVSSKLVAAKSGAGESDLQGRYIRMDHYTFLKQAEQRNQYQVRLWKTAKGAQTALIPNLNTNDQVWKKLLQNSDFRRALSLAIHRHEINQVIYFGLVNEGNDTVLPGSPLYRPQYQTNWAGFDLKLANQLLDKLGLTSRDDRGIRLLPDGRPMEIIVQTAGESTEQTDTLELIHDSWLKAGIKLYSVPSTREVFRNRIFSGDAIMAIWSGLPNGLAAAESSPADLAPTSRYQYQWPKWGQYHESGGKKGEAPVLESVNELQKLNQKWKIATDHESKESIWHKMLTIHSNELFTIGLVNSVLQPVVVNNALNNVPEEGYFHFSPGAYFGIYKPDTFWFNEERR